MPNRFGLINMLVSTEDIPKGNEFTVSYGYHFASAPLWYKKLMKKYMEDNPHTWQLDDNLIKQSEHIDVLNWNETSEFVSFKAADFEKRRKEIQATKKRTK